MTTTLRAGIHPDIPSAVYHADPAPEPSLSAGIAHRLISRSPLHAQAAHPRLNPDHKEEQGGILDFGSAAHSLLLEGLDICQIVEFDDWRKQAARDERDAARKSGLIPLLRKDYARMCELVEAVKAQIAQLDVAPLPLRDGKSEQTLVWQEDGVWCRARIDWLHDEADVMDDLKTTGTTANPYVWARQRLFADGKDIQCAFYKRGLKATTGIDPDWRFVVCETEPPHAVSVISLAASALELADRKVERAIALWKRCIESGEWPGYPREIAMAEMPPWEEARYLEQHYEPEEVPA
jgi:hypothetical protein